MVVLELIEERREGRRFLDSVKRVKERVERSEVSSSSLSRSWDLTMARSLGLREGSLEVMVL